MAKKRIRWCSKCKGYHGEETKAAKKHEKHLGVMRRTRRLS